MNQTEFHESLARRLQAIDPSAPPSFDAMVAIGDAYRARTRLPQALRATLGQVSDDALTPLARAAVSAVEQALASASADELVLRVDEVSSLETALYGVGVARRQMLAPELIDPLRQVLRTAHENLAARISRSAVDEALAARKALYSRDDHWANALTWLGGAAPRTRPSELHVAEYAAQGLHADEVERAAQREPSFDFELASTLALLAEAHQPLGLAARRWLKRRETAGGSPRDVIELDWPVRQALAAADERTSKWTDMTLGRLAPIDAEAQIVVENSWAKLFVFPMEDGAPITRVRFGEELVLEADARGVWHAKVALTATPIVLRVDDARGETFAVSLRPVPLQSDRD